MDHRGDVQRVRGRAGRYLLGRDDASPIGLERLQILVGIAATGGNVTATIVSNDSQLYSTTET